MAYCVFNELIILSPVTAVSTLIVVFLGILYFFLKDRGLPPGPTGLPYLGYWPFLRDEDVHLHLTEMKEKYGDVYSLTIMGRLFIHLGSIQSIKDMLISKEDGFADRYRDYGIFKIMFDKGITTVTGEEWKVIRKFFVQSFREYGLSTMKEHLKGTVDDSLNAFVQILKSTDGSSVNVVPAIYEQVSNIFRRMVFNDVEITDEELKSLLDTYQIVLPLNFGKKPLLLGEFARYFIFKRLDGFHAAVENLRKMQDTLRKIIRRHESTFKEDNIRDLIDQYIKERNDRRKRGDPTAQYFTEDALISSFVQILGDGILSVGGFVGTFVRYLLEYPEEQEKIYNELENVIGTDRRVTLQDRGKLPYTNAYMQEVMRITDFLTYMPSYVCTRNKTLCGYNIPKGALIVLNFWSAHRDPNVFEEPEQFKPSRYIGEEGKPKAESPIIFGVGKRACAGESFAMMQVFLFLTTLVQNFRLELPKSAEKKILWTEGMEVLAYPRK